MNFIYLFENVPSNTWLSQDQLSVLIKPTNDFNLENDYILEINTGYLTGDIKDNVILPIRIKKYFELTISTKMNSELEPLSHDLRPLNGNKKLYILPDSNYSLESAEYIGNYFFLGWECESDSIINGNKSNQITINKSKNELLDLEISAVYAKIPDDSIRIELTDGGLNRVVAGNGITIDSTCVVLPRMQDYDLVIRAVPQVGYRFVEWQSSDTLYNGMTDVSITIPSFINKTEEQLLLCQKKQKWDTPLSGFESQFPETITPYTLDLIPVFELIPPGDPEEQRVCFQVIYNEPGESLPSNFNIINYIYTAQVDDFELKYNFINPNNDVTIAEVCWEVCLNSPNCTPEIYFILDPNSPYVIEYWSTSAGYTNQKGSITDKLDNEIAVTFSETMRQTPYNTMLITIHVRKKRFNLDIEIQEKSLSDLRFRSIVGDPIITNAILRKNSIMIPNIEYQYKDKGTPSECINKVTYRYEVKIGDSPEIRPTLYEANKGMKLGYWDNSETRFTFMDVTDPLTQNLRINNVLNNKVCRFNYLADFQLVKVRYMRMLDLTNDGSKTQEYSMAWLEYTKEKNFGENYLAEVALREPTTIVNNDIWTGYTHFTTKIELEFNNDVDPSCFSNDELWAEDILDPNTPGKWFRLDGKNLQRYLAIGNNITVNGKTVSFKLLSTNNVQIPNMSDFKLHITERIKDIDGNYLQNPQNIQKKTEFPGMRIYMSGFKLRMDTDPGPTNDVLIHCGAACYYENIMNGEKLNFFSFAKEPNMQMLPGMGLPLNLLILNVQRLCENSVIGYGAHVIDPDYGLTSDKFNEIVNNALGKLDKEAQSSWAIGAALVQGAAAYMWNGLNSDDELSVVNYLGTYRDLWGLKKTDISTKILYKWFNPMLSDKNYHYFKIILY